jgi:hypothetical protein
MPEGNAGLSGRRGVPANMGVTPMQCQLQARFDYRRRASARLLRSIDMSTPRHIITVSIADPP